MIDYLLLPQSTPSPTLQTPHATPTTTPYPSTTSSHATRGIPHPTSSIIIPSPHHIIQYIILYKSITLTGSHGATTIGNKRIAQTPHPLITVTRMSQKPSFLHLTTLNRHTLTYIQLYRRARNGGGRSVGHSSGTEPSVGVGYSSTVTVYVHFTRYTVNLMAVVGKRGARTTERPNAMKTPRQGCCIHQGEFLTANFFSRQRGRDGVITSHE